MDNVTPLDEPTTEKNENFRSKVSKKIASRNWTWTLRILTFIAAGGMIASGVIGFLSTDSKSPLGYIVLIYEILLGAILLAVLVPYPRAWAVINMKWLPFLHTYRGRGAFLVLMGSLAAGTVIINIFIGIGIIVIGLFHILLACWFKNTLDQSDFKKHRIQQSQQEEPTRNNQDLQQVEVNAAWGDHQHAYDNRGFIDETNSNQGQYY